MTRSALIDSYLDGPRQLRAAIAGMSLAQLDARPVAGKMSSKEVICHIADFEPVYADRMKRVIAEDQPPLRGGDPDAWTKALGYAARDINEELDLIDVVRRQMARVLKSLPESAWSRVGIHSEAGPLTLEDLLKRVTNHVPHHVKFIEEKRRTLGA